jgi:hypothetical protein
MLFPRKRAGFPNAVNRVWGPQSSPSDGFLDPCFRRSDTVCSWISRSLPPTYSAWRVGVCHFERSAAQSRNLASNMACRPFPARFLHAAFGLGRNDNSRPSMYEVLRSNPYDKSVRHRLILLEALSSLLQACMADDGESAGKLQWNPAAASPRGLERNASH